MSDTQDVDSRISSAVWQLIDAHGINVTELGVAVGISTTNLYRRLNAGVTWKARDVAAVARHFGVTVGDLFSGLPLAVSPKQ